MSQLALLAGRGQLVAETYGLSARSGYACGRTFLRLFYWVIVRPCVGFVLRSLHLCLHRVGT